jgi:hypothetical protein
VTIAPRTTLAAYGLPESPGDLTLDDLRAELSSPAALALAPTPAAPIRVGGATLTWSDGPVEVTLVDDQGELRLTGTAGLLALYALRAHHDEAAVATPALTAPTAWALALRGLVRRSPAALAARITPRAGDAAAVFQDPALATPWSAGDLLPAGAGPLEVWLASPGSPRLAGGWSRVLPHLTTDALVRPWAAWRVHPHGAQGGTRYEGLVWLDDHWAWFPKPWRALPSEVRHVTAP